jgi:adenine-specific DNA-methyltransferase
MPTLDFKGKQFVYSHHHSVPFRELEVDEEKSLPTKGKKPTLDDNLIIHGDNLHALKALMPQYAGKIKCIYIDPPYNTGNEGWCYNDNVNSPLMKEWLKKNANPVDKEDLQRHDKWLCMMWPRLKLLHELLADDGVIFVSIDDNEVHHLRAIMNEIWGEDNFVANIVWQKKSAPNNNQTGISCTHDYVCLYQKTNEFSIKRLEFEGDNNRLKNPDNDSRGEWISVDLGGVAYRENLQYKIKNPSGQLVSPPSRNGWKVSEAVMQGYIADNRIWWGANSSGVPRYKKFKYELEAQGLVPSTWWTRDFASDNQAAKKEIDIIMQTELKAFDTPKPVSLITKILKLATDKDSIILDSFAGSGTTAHAVLDLNKEDGGNRKFILVEVEDYADKTTAERVRRVIKGVSAAKDEKLKAGLGGSFTFCNLGKEISIEKIITGEALPDYGALAKYVFYTATGHSLDKDVKSKPDYFVGETDLYEVYLIYKPDIALLRGNESALNDAKLKAIAERNNKKEKLVFATAKYMGQKELSDHNITFCQLPYAIHKVVGA